MLSLIVSYAQSISIGDKALVEGIDNLIPSEVISVSSLMMQGNHSLILIKFVF